MVTFNITLRCKTSPFKGLRRMWQATQNKKLMATTGVIQHASCCRTTRCCSTPHQHVIVPHTCENFVHYALSFLILICLTDQKPFVTWTWIRLFLGFIWSALRYSVLENAGPSWYQRSLEQEDVSLTKTFFVDYLDVVAMVCNAKNETERIDIGA